jgi:hypothetical protein
LRPKQWLPEATSAFAAAAAGEQFLETGHKLPSRVSGAGAALLLLRFQRRSMQRRHWPALRTPDTLMSGPKLARSDDGKWPRD